MLCLLISTPTISHNFTPEATVIMVKVETIKCVQDHPKLKPEIDSALAVWRKRNEKYVANVEQHSEYASVIAHTLASSNKDGPIPLEACRSLIQGLPDHDLDKPF